MQVNIAEKYRLKDYASEAESILRRCVHCGFCNATCPTFQLLGDELDGPRGRIYLIKQILEGTDPTPASRSHLDRCLTCQSCESTCPSGVQYSRLLETGRQLHHEQLKRPWQQIALRKMLRLILLRPRLFKLLLQMGHATAFMLPAAMQKKLPPLGKSNAVANLNQQASVAPASSSKTIIMLRGCAQQVCAPEINHSAATLFNQLGYHVIESTFDQCCGALSQHNDATEEARLLAKKNIDAWWPEIEQGAAHIAITASGCATMIKEYGHLLSNDDLYKEKAQRVSELCCDPIDILSSQQQSLVRDTAYSEKIVYHAPCTQQHGLKIKGQVENLLEAAGFKLMPQSIGHLCCGSAGSYSVIQPVLSQQLKVNKLEDLTKQNPDLIATANIGCLMQLQTGTQTPVKHWLQLLEVDKSGS